MTTVRRATREDIPSLAVTLARAFVDYAWTRWIIPAEHHEARLEALFALDLEVMGVPYKEVWTTDDNAAVAVWIPPNASEAATIDWERHGRESAPILGDRLVRADAADALIAPHRPKEPHWYLATASTLPERQRQGLGRAVLMPVMERCDADGMPALTETSSEDNVRFYQRVGFDVLQEIEMPDEGPPVWMLWREPHR